MPADDGEADQYEDITDLGVSEYAEPPFDGEAVAVAAAAALAATAAAISRLLPTGGPKA